MSLTSAQLTTLKNDIAADPVLKTKPHNSDGAFEVAAAYNLQASPSFTVWKTNVVINLIGKAFDAAELGNRTQLENARLQTLAQYLAGGVDPSLASNRQFFDDVFNGAGGTNTRANLLALWKRLATRAEKLFATGTGSDAVPAMLSFEGLLTIDDVLDAWSS